MHLFSEFPWFPIQATPVFKVERRINYLFSDYLLSPNHVPSPAEGHTATLVSTLPKTILQKP